MLLMERLILKFQPTPLPVITFWSAVGLSCVGCLLLNVFARFIGLTAIFAYVGLVFCCSWAAVLSFVLTIVCYRRQKCSGIQLIVQMPIALYCIYLLIAFFNTAV